MQALLNLWDFHDASGSEARFRQALETANPDEALMLHTQIARSHGLRKNFVEAQRILNDDVKPHLSRASAEVTARFWLEWGRTLCSVKHDKTTYTDTIRSEARAAFEQAFELARVAKLDGLAVDALHMIAFTQSSPEDSFQLNQRILAFIETSSDPTAKAWEASVRNNLGCDLHSLSRYDDALTQFNKQLELREKQGNVENIRIAHWMIAWTLRAMKRFDEAITIQLRLEREFNADGKPDPYVYEELAELYTSINDSATAEHYRTLQKSSSSA
jgi:tetratricopeptide (TPR) repeat protein